MFCLNRHGERPLAKRLRCAIFLLQLLSTVLKNERGASHPERSSHHTANHLPGLPGDAPKAATTANNGWKKIAAQACAREASTYLVRMVEAATALMLGGRNGAVSSEDVEGSLGGADAVFWVLSLVSDILKCLRKRFWRFGDPSSIVRCKRKRDGDAGRPETASDLPPSTTAVVSEQLDVPGLAEVVLAVPVGSGMDSMDIELKWVEVTQLLVEAAKTRWRSVLVGLLRSVPPTLWRLANNGSLLLQEEPSRSPGSAFVEERGADGALAQAMLGLVFRTVRLGDERGPFDVAALVDARDVPNNEGRTEELDKRERVGAPQNQPWTTAVEALVAMATASADDQESCLGFAGRLVRLFADQDDALVDMLLLNLHIFHNTAKAELDAGSDRPGSDSPPPALRTLYRGALHPGVLFAALLFEVRFDSGVLLDWLTSPETAFLQYLTMLLRFAVAEWSDFAARVSCARVVALEDGVDAVQKTEDEKEMEEEEEEEEGLVLSEEEANRLGRAMSCLSGLVASARALDRNGLVPYNIAPLLRRIDQVVSLYEECGDAEQEEEESASPKK
ncbi:unnamed protein product [Ectocarpus sp. 13 AM-2016]